MCPNFCTRLALLLIKKVARHQLLLAKNRRGCHAILTATLSCLPKITGEWLESRVVYTDIVNSHRLALLDALLRLRSFVSINRSLKDLEHRLWASVGTVPRILTCSSKHASLCYAICIDLAVES